MTTFQMKSDFPIIIGMISTNSKFDVMNIISYLRKSLRKGKIYLNAIQGYQAVLNEFTERYGNPNIIVNDGRTDSIEADHQDASWGRGGEPQK